LAKKGARSGPIKGIKRALLGTSISW
jgi:hypothetical protein